MFKYLIKLTIKFIALWALAYGVFAAVSRKLDRMAREQEHEQGVKDNCIYLLPSPEEQ